MSGDPFDAQGEAHEALSTAVGSYGARVLSDPRILGNLVTDLLPDSPRERSLLVTAAEAGVASELAQHVDQQHLDADTAVELVARRLTDRRSIDIAASTWVTMEYARALGYQVRSPATPPGQFGGQPVSDPTATVRRPQPSPMTPPFPAPQPPLGQSPGVPPASPGVAPLFPQPPQPVQSPGAAPFYGQPPEAVSDRAQYQPTIQQSPVAPPLPFQGAGYQSGGQQAGYQPQSSPPGYQPPSYGSQPSSGYQPGYQPSTSPTSPYQSSTPSQPAGFAAPGYQSAGSPGQPWGPTQPPRNSRKGLLWGGIGGGAVVIIAVVAIILAGNHTTTTHPNSNSSLQASATHSAAPTHSPSASPSASASPTPAPTIPASITPLVKLLPSDINDFETECVSQPASQLPFKAAGLVSALKCSDPGLPGGNVFAFQFDNAHDYVQSWAAFNKWWGFDPSSAGTTCPPSSSSATAQGVTGWSSGVYPSHGGQEVECQYVTVSGTSTAQSNLEPDYVWSYPTEWAFIDGQGAAGSSFTALQNWWHNS